MEQQWFFNLSQKDQKISKKKKIANEGKTMFCITYTHGTKEMQNRGEIQKTGVGRAVGWGKEEN